MDASQAPIDRSAGEDAHFACDGEPGTFGTLPKRVENRSLAHRLASAYLDAKVLLVERGFAAELDWQYQTSLERTTESEFLTEAAWVILSSGMSERVVRSRFPRVLRAFENFESAANVWSARRINRLAALRVFGHAGKIDAIIAITGYTARVGFDYVHLQLAAGALEFLLQFSYLGPATAKHLAKNLGASIAKPDRHLKRMAASLGFSDVDGACEAISELTGDPVQVVDVVLWRYCTLGQRQVIDFVQTTLEG